jgi:hypothetical protein
MLSIQLVTNFWDFPSSSKRNVLTAKHAPIICQALEDKQTRIDLVDAGLFMLYSEEESLLVKTTDPIIQTLLLLCQPLLEFAQSC